MSDLEPQPAAPKPPSGPRFQFTLGTLLLLCVVLASSLAVFGAWGIAVFALLVALAIPMHVAENPRPIAFLVVILLCSLFTYGLSPAYQSASEAARQLLCTANLKHIALALHDYNATNGSFPPAYTADKAGQPLHSWRTLILPCINEAPLFDSLSLNLPWNAAKNTKQLSNSMPIYKCPNDNAWTSPVALTNYLAVVGSNTAWPGTKPRKLADFAGKKANTILVVDVANSDIHWAEPRDLLLEALPPAKPQPSGISLSSNHPHREDFFHVYDHHAGVYVAMVDGSTHFLYTDGLSDEELRRKFEIGGCKDEDFDDDACFPRGRLNWPNIAALAVWLLSVGALLTQAVRGRKRPPAAKPY